MTAEVQIEVGQTEEEFTDLVNHLKDRVGLTQISSATIHLVLKEAMELVEELNIPGAKKRDNVVAIVKALVIDLVENEEEEKLIISLIEKQVLENAMSLIILASKGDLKLNNKKDRKKITAFLGSCVPITFNFIFYLVKSCMRKKSTSSAAPAAVTEVVIEAVPEVVTEAAPPEAVTEAVPEAVPEAASELEPAV
jgi:hypothetical protein